ncbi:MAG: hypothetical protein ACOCX1_01685 [Fimbriimonadaceae bacterium]
MLVSALPIWQPLILGDSIGPFDQIMAMDPWQKEAPEESWDVLQADGVLQFFFWRDLVLQGWAVGDLPFWNPYQLMGTPLLANSQSGALYPPHIVVGLIFIPLGTTTGAITFLAWAHLFWAGLGVAYLTRRLGASANGAWLAGALMSTSPFLLAWLPLASVPTTVAWIPWLLASVLILHRAVALRKSWGRALAGFSASGAMLVLGGHLQFAAYGFMAALVFWIALAVAERAAPRRLGASALALAAGVALAGGLAAPQLLPVLSFSQYSHRQAEATAEGYTAYASGGVGIVNALGVAQPRVLGLTGQGADLVPESDAGESPAPLYWPKYNDPGANFAEASGLFLGFVAFGLLFALKREDWKRAIPSAVVAGLGLMLGLGTIANAPLYYMLPGWSATGSPGRAAVLFLIGAVVLAGMAVPGDLRSHGEARTKKALVAAWGATLTGMALAYVLGPIEALLANLLYIIAAGVLGTFTLVLLFRGDRSWGGVALAAVAQVVMVGPSVIPTATDPLPETEPEPNVRSAFINESWNLFFRPDAMMPPNTAGGTYRYDIAGYDSLLHRDTVAWLREVNGGQDPAPPENGNMMFIKPGFRLDLLSESGVGYVYSQTPLPSHPMLRETESALPNVFAYQLSGFGRAYVELEGNRPSPESATIVEDGLSQQVVEANGPGTLVIKDRNMEGWSATVNGEPVTISGDFWREVEIPAGESTVEFSYSPPGLRNGIIAFSLSSLLVLALAIGFRPGSATTQDPENS